jgi:hypothetical protein
VWNWEKLSLPVNLRKVKQVVNLHCTCRAVQSKMQLMGGISSQANFWYLLTHCQGGQKWAQSESQWICSAATGVG